MVSAFGSTQFPTSQGFDANSTCSSMATFVRDNMLDGIDLDYEDNQAMNGVSKGKQKWLPRRRESRKRNGNGEPIYTL